MHAVVAGTLRDESYEVLPIALRRRLSQIIRSRDTLGSLAMETLCRELNTYWTRLKHRLIKLPREAIRLTTIKQLRTGPLSKDTKVDRRNLLIHRICWTRPMDMKLEHRKLLDQVLANRIPRLLLHPATLLLNIQANEVEMPLCLVAAVGCDTASRRWRRRQALDA